MSTEEPKQTKTETDLAQDAMAEIKPFLRPEKAQEAKVVISRVISRQHSGPLPPADELANYENVHPGLAERIVAMAEKSQDHRHDIERKIVTGELGLKKAGQWFAIIGLSLLLAAVAYLAYCGNAVAAASLGTATIVAVVAIFVTGRHFDKESERQARPPKSDQKSLPASNKRRKK